MDESILSLAKHVTEHCELMIEEAQAHLRAPLFEGEYDDMEYWQGRKDACRVILLVVADHA